MLAELHEKVPEQARVAIENTMATSLMNRERVVEALKNKGALVGIPEEAPALARIQAEVIERVQERIQERLQEENAERVPEPVQEKIQERTQAQISRLQPDTLKPAVTDNKTEQEETAATETRRVRKSQPQLIIKPEASRP